MADVYLTEDALLRDYAKLNQEYQNKAGKYIKNLLKIQRAESGVTARLFELNRTRRLNLNQDPKKLYCNFCGKSEDDADRLIVGRSRICICDECARLCGEVLDEAEEDKKDGENDRKGPGREEP